MGHPVRGLVLNYAYEISLPWTMMGLARTMTLLRAPGNSPSPAVAAFRDLLVGTRMWLECY